MLAAMGAGTALGMRRSAAQTTVVQRVAAAIRNFTPDERAGILPNGLEAELKRHHYDIASVAMNPAGMAVTETQA